MLDRQEEGLSVGKWTYLVLTYFFYIFFTSIPQTEICKKVGWYISNRQNRLKILITNGRRNITVSNYFCFLLFWWCCRISPVNIRFGIFSKIHLIIGIYNLNRKHTSLAIFCREIDVYRPSHLFCLAKSSLGTYIKSPSQIARVL